MKIKIEGSRIQKILVAVQVLFLLTSIGMTIYMTVSNNHDLAIEYFSKGLLYFAIAMGLFCTLLDSDKDEKKEKKDDKEEKSE